MSTVRDLGLLVLRVGMAASCFSHGARRLAGRIGGDRSEDTGEAISASGVRPGERDTRTTGVLGTVGGALLALGVATGPVGAALAGTMIAARTVPAANGGYELPVSYALVGSTLAVTGPGRFSLDHLTGEALNRPWLRALALVGALATAAYVVSIRSAILAEDDADED